MREQHGPHVRCTDFRLCSAHERLWGFFLLQLSLQALHAAVAEGHFLAQADWLRALCALTILPHKTFPVAGTKKP